MDCALLVGLFICLLIFIVFHDQDRNDIAPVFSSLPRPVRLQNTIPVGQVVTTVTAVDSDGTAPNNQV